MGTINITLEDENGVQLEAVEGRVYLIGRVLPLIEDETFQCLRFIDPYGDTVFNRPQMGQFIRELDSIMGRAETPEEKAILLRVRELAEKCESEPHLYLKFYGD